MIVAIDGPAGSGKSTTAKAVARQLGYLYIDTGAMYRAVALAFLREDLQASEEAARRVLPSIHVDLRPGDQGLRVFLNDEDVTESVRGSAVTNRVSEIAALPSVRRKLVDEQRRIAQSHKEGGVVLDGRDIGTVVFPHADVKIFMVADDRTRARRRRDELVKRGEDVSLEEVLRDIRRRDEHDSSRAAAPLIKAEDAIEVDTSDVSIEKQIDRVLDVVKERQNLSAV